MSSSSLVRMVLTVVLPGLLLLSATRVRACSIILDDKRYVGDTDPSSPTYDARCTDPDIQTAIDNATCPRTIITISNEHAWTAQHLTVQGKSLSLVGAAGGCNPPPVVCGTPPCAPTPSPLVVLSGAGHTGDSVVTIKGNSQVTLQNLQITGGQESSDGHGGGVYFDGTGTLTLDGDTINANRAGYGAGVYINGDGGIATLNINDNTLIEGNTAQHDGGGIMAEGQAGVMMFGNPSFIGINKALDGYGGGIEVIGPAYLEVGSPGYVNLGAIYGNSAAYGGGIALRSNDDNDTEGRVFTSDPLHAVAIQSNSASVQGGGLYLRSHNSGVTGSNGSATVCVDQARIDDNIAPEGAAVYLDRDTAFGQIDAGSALSFNNASYCTISPVPSNAVACMAGVACNEITGNTALDSDDQPTNGAVILVQDRSYAWLQHVQVRRNRAGYAINAVTDGDFTTTWLNTCLFAENQFSQQLISGSSNALTIANCTFANDIIDATHVFRLDDDSILYLQNSIIAEAGTLALDKPGGVVGNSNLVIADVLSNDISTLPTSSDIVQGDPMFRSLTQGDYRLRAYTLNGVTTTSPAIDFAPAVSGNDRDLDGLLFDQDVPAAVDRFGTRDLGAYESQPITDRIFADAFGDAISLVY